MVLTHLSIAKTGSELSPRATPLLVGYATNSLKPYGGNNEIFGTPLVGYPDREDILNKNRHEALIRPQPCEGWGAPLPYQPKCGLSCENTLQ
jgi:hypothetical protein